MSAPGISGTTLGRALTLLHTGVTTRALLTAELGLTRTGVSKVLAELAAYRLVDIDSRPAPLTASAGRPSHGVRPAAAGPLVLAATVDADAVTVALVGLGGEVVRRATRALPAGATPERAAGIVARLAASLAGREGRPVLGVGVTIESAVDAADGSALAALYLGWPPDVPLRDLVTRALRRAGLDLPVTLGNDINCAAIAEHRHGAGRDARYLLYLSSGHRGIGGALIAGGRLYGGRDGAAMEIGHVIVNPGGRPCHCGNRGCLDVEAGPTAMFPVDDPRARRAGVEDRARAVLADPASAATVRRVLRHLRTGVAGLINVLNPDRVVFAGLLADLLAHGGPRLRRAVADRTLLRAAGDVAMRPGQVADASLMGAAEQALQPLLDDPRQVIAARPRR